MAWSWPLTSVIYCRVTIFTNSVDEAPASFSCRQDGDRRILCDVGKYVPDYTQPHSRTEFSSFHWTTFLTERQKYGHKLCLNKAPSAVQVTHSYSSRYQEFILYELIYSFHFISCIIPNNLEKYADFHKCLVLTEPTLPCYNSHNTKLSLRLTN
jgi:hypothetical protein